MDSPKRIGRWEVSVATGTAQELHDREPDFSGRRIVVQRVSAPALVLGSTQSVDLVDTREAAARGVAIARRRSGGGAVYLTPDEQAWIDVFLPAGDPLWSDDIRRSSEWLGYTWARVAESYGWLAPEVHAGALSDPEASRLVCFAAIGPGEVSAEGSKIVGISQRRTRQGARFQCIAYLAWNPADVLGLLNLGAGADSISETLNSSAHAMLRVSGGASSPRATASQPGTRVERTLVERTLVERFVELLP